MIHTIHNEQISITISERGAELQSLKRLTDGAELLWQGHSEYWKGQSPILFPVVGNTYRHEVRFGGKLYEMPKHGFAREADFVLTRKTDNYLEFQTEANTATLKHYPFPFQLTVTYQIEGNVLNISFQIHNTQPMPLHYQIGAHPAFNLPDFDNQEESIYGYLGFNIKDKLVSNGLKPGGYLWPEGAFDVRLDNEGLLPLKSHTFDCDTILDSRALMRTCVLYNRMKKPIVSLRFESPVLALWAPKRGKAPFVCIEPWWGCCDLDGYGGEFSRRFCINTVAGDTTNQHNYSITVNSQP